MVLPEDIMIRLPLGKQPKRETSEVYWIGLEKTQNSERDSSRLVGRVGRTSGGQQPSPIKVDILKQREKDANNWEDFRKTWIESLNYIPEKSEHNYSRSGGSAHPIQDLVQKVRKVFLDLGYTEVENPFFIQEEDVYKQYGPEAPVILDRVYYLAGIPRPDIGLGKNKTEKIPLHL